MRRTLSILLLLLVCNLARAQDDIVVVASSRAVESLDRTSVRNLFMGNLRVEGLRPVNLPAGNPVRVLFNTRVIGLTEARIQSYWAQMRFSGRSRPPPEVNDVQSLLDLLLEQRGNVGYLPADIDLPEGLTVLFRTD